MSPVSPLEEVRVRRKVKRMSSSLA